MPKNIIDIEWREKMSPKERSVKRTTIILEEEERKYIVDCIKKGW